MSLVNWEMYPKRYKWAAQDECGTVVLFTAKPTATGKSGFWRLVSGEWENYGEWETAISGDYLEIYDEDAESNVENWRETLERRPKGV